MVTVQRLAARALGEVLVGKNLDRALESLLAREKNLPSGERAAVHAIAFSTVRHLGLLNAQLNSLATKPIADAPVRQLILVALSQIQFSRVNAHTIVDQAVETASAIGFARAKGLVNAVLRNYLRDPARLSRERFAQEEVIYDFPLWWIARLRDECAETDGRAEAMLLSSREQPPMWLRVNRRRGSTNDYLGVLAANGLGVETVDGDAVRLATPVAVDRLPGFRDGRVSVQDLGAQRAAPLLGLAAGQRVLDACAAPGGKTGHIAEWADVELTAIDHDEARLARVASNLKRLNRTATLICADAAAPATWWDGQPFDRILLDVPCSGSGVVRRHPDIKWIRRESDIDQFAGQQRGLIDALWPTLSPGGRLLYATCSIFEAENEAIANAFLAAHADARAVPIGHPGASGEASLHAAKLGENGGLRPANPFARLDPNHAHDGFFYALLEKLA
jgi:16S rRNA (cytosine967-C5)-methyltransferase